MKRVVLLRHAKSSWDEKGLADADRPLSKRGRDDAPRMGKRLARRGVRPELLLTSPAVRARHTAELVAPALGNPALGQRIEPALYLASPGEILHVLAGLDEAVREVVIVAHNPGLTDLVKTLLPELGLLNLPTAGVVAIDCETPSWRAIDAAAFRLAFYDYPKNPPPK